MADELGRQREFGLAAFRKSFVESRSLADLDNVLAAATDAGLDPDEVAAGIQRDEIKERLKSNTAEALERGVTGIPTVAIGDELFWGDDHLESGRRERQERPEPRASRAAASRSRPSSIERRAS